MGCTSPSASGMVFVLVPVPTAEPGKPGRRVIAPTASGDNDTATDEEPTPPPTPDKSPRRFRRARYVADVPKSAKVDVGDSDHRRKVLRAVQDSGQEGVLSRDIMRRSGLEHNQTQQALYWLRAHNFVHAREEHRRRPQE